MRMTWKTTSVALALAAFVSPALATGEIETLITRADRDRLSGFDAAKAKALAEARAGGSAQDVATLNEVVSAEHLPFEGFDMTGDWQCRTIKAGGLAQLVVYGWFRCQVTDDGSGWALKKLTGSQRTTGRFFTNSDVELTYLGSGSVNEETPLPYGAGPDTDQAGHAYRTAEDAWQIEFPSPRYESKFDILQLKR
jgi:hypothetical protein